MRGTLRILLGAGVLGAAMLAGASRAPAQPVDADQVRARCSALAGPAGGEVVVSAATLEQAGPMAGGPGAAATDLPLHCRVRGIIGQRVGVGGRAFGVGFELRLPVNWNGRFLFQGGGGLDGVINPAIGRLANSGQAPALARGFAVVSTDAGHTGSPLDATFALDQQARVDYAYDAIGKVTPAAKALVARFYGRPADHSYFAGCSNGGRQALTAAQRFPLYFDGIVAGDPTLRFSRVGIDEVWNLGVLARIAPRGPDGRPIISKAFSADDLGLVKAALLKRCDARDGVADGQIQDWRGCDFDPAQVQCRPGQSAGCLSAAKVTALRELHRGPRTPSGEIVYGPFNFDTGIAGTAWRGMRLGRSETGVADAADATLGLGMLRYFQLTPPDPQYDPWKPADLDALLRRVRETAAIGDADSPFLSTFVLHGKLIAYNGLSDQGLASSELARWAEQARAATGQGAEAAMRLYFVPGMTHCGGGEATDQFEMLDAMVDWVEHGRAPDRILARTSSGPPLSRPLCPHPTIARYKGGDPADAASFECRA
jgi:feruloyl esterase